MKSIKPNVLFQCTKCPKHYRRKLSLKAHLNVTHNKVKQQQCYFCSFAAVKNSHLIQHMSKHTKEKPYKCQYCCQWFRRVDSVRRHKNGNSCNLKLTYGLLSPCYFCCQGFSKQQYLIWHMKKVHLKEDFKRCNLCDKYFCSTTAMNYHITTVHLLQRNYKCQLCFKRLGRNSDLHRHIRSVHTKEKHFKCYFCSKSFVDFEALKLHTWIHTKENPLNCYFCLKDFSFAQNLSVHIGRIHTKERAFKCKQCPSRCYSSKGDLNRHTRLKHGIGFRNE
jgi:uncharacterized Zn-finger protein